MHTSAPSGAVNLMVLASTAMAVMNAVVLGSQVGAPVHFTSVVSFVSRSFTVYSTPGSTMNLMPQPTVPLAFVHPNFRFSGEAYS